jgi:murein DD-endopeptidase MepM/ murein hydrolase activator NlpD
MVMTLTKVISAKSLLMLCLLCFLGACSSHNGPLAIFRKLSPHDQYGQHLLDAGLGNTALGREWSQQALQVLTVPLAVTLPYRESGYFAAERINAAALSFTAKRGLKINVSLRKKPADLIIYTDLFLNGTLVASADSNAIIYEIKQTGNYILRLQPELLKGGEYTLDIWSGPALHFPVSASGRPKIEGFWGDGRDDKSRKHEGIDIFAPKGTPALAAANGTVTSVSENKLGGLVVFMQPEGSDYTLYYAHLGVQLVHNGQQVKVGDTVGLIDNTGNAKTTPSHLHFGIYTNGGAIDPLLFVKPVHEEMPLVTATLAKLNATIRVSNMPAKVLAATKNLYKVSYPDNTVAFVTTASARSLTDIKQTFRNAGTLYDQPDTTAARILQIAPGSDVIVKGTFKNYELVTYKDLTGWVYDKK